MVIRLPFGNRGVSAGNGLRSQFAVERVGNERQRENALEARMTH